ncbi:MAG: hypothetical protein US40_C0003G0061 [Candidatus Roizmanbacteria bacterium GW2011_GWC2_37_13]|uniref:Uncharacterized protein n=1 Tax=Candidatus Roizmanbacteria bacterium GW2011_GWC2_37_13 TaxID=1618486 RepID=A0A0G0IPY3_9BACT|nr:MAG: hypothetical protein US38_C0004G0060 [Candidatus Roizmanbacteria bacterium GW2011_GWC1_37_12]KKQ26209.1 MAG: hypothetical protein US40_C0003G0061 [Candidatus Roizmanbacteria bacterium GW2011_GWC2_37_13]
MKEFIGLVTVILVFVSIIPYIIDIFRNKTKPHMFTWMIWTLTTSLTFFGQWQKGAGAGSWTTATAGLLVVFIALISIKKGSKDIAKFDVIMLVAALLAIFPWMLTKDPTLSVVILTAIDVSGFFPTIRKTIKNPESETFISYVINAIRHSLSIFAIANYNLVTYIYPACLAVMNIIVLSIILKSRFKK